MYVARGMLSYGMSGWKQLVAARDDARQHHIELIRERIAIYMRNDVELADEIARLRKMLRHLENVRPTFADSC